MLNRLAYSTPKPIHRNRYTKFQKWQDIQEIDEDFGKTKTKLLFHILLIIMALLCCITCCKISYDAFLKVIKAILCGVAAICFSWEILYFDSTTPGVTPPTPLTPQRYKESVMYTCHTSYLFSAINGILLTVMVFLWL